MVVDVGLGLKHEQAVAKPASAAAFPLVTVVRFEGAVLAAATTESNVAFAATAAAAFTARGTIGARVTVLVCVVVTKSLSVLVIVSVVPPDVTMVLG